MQAEAFLERPYADNSLADPSEPSWLTNGRSSCASVHRVGCCFITQRPCRRALLSDGATGEPVLAVRDQAMVRVVLWHMLMLVWLALLIRRGWWMWPAFEKLEF